MARSLNSSPFERPERIPGEFDAKLVEMVRTLPAEGDNVEDWKSLKRRILAVGDPQLWLKSA